MMMPDFGMIKRSHTQSMIYVTEGSPGSGRRPGGDLGDDDATGPASKKVNLALQGGGAHGAFVRGVRSIVRSKLLSRIESPPSRDGFNQRIGELAQQ
jgi:hypothetical protein